ncbi:hypothetical protein [Micromonospora sp. NPDC023956]|uniref:hypothetical protein n=1 Tax=Micromonospora sp. NPDC023956 TaxID=3155722 RepID=UPI0033D17037
MMAIVVALTAALLLGLAAGWQGHRMHTAAHLARLDAAHTAIGDPDHWAQVVAHYARLLHIHPRRTR